MRAIGEMVVNVGVAAFQKFGEVIGDSISAARESNQVAAQTAQVIKSTGSAAGVTTQHVLDYASALSAASGKSLFGHEQIAQSTNLLLTFTNIKGATLDAATAISVDMAQALGGAPKDAAIQLGKALNDPVKGITALTRVGVTFSDEQKAMIKAMQESGDTAGAQQVILNELNKEFGGSAEAAAKADGGFAQFQDRLGEMEETIGKAILPVLGQLMGFVNDQVLPGFESLTNQIGPFIEGLEPIFTSAATSIQAFAASIIDAFTGAQGATGSIAEDLGYFLDTLIGVQGEAAGPFQSAIALVGSIVNDYVIPAFQTVWTVLQTQVWPILQDLGTALFPLVGAAIQILAGFWTDVLVPALTTFWQFLTGFVLPIVAALAGWLRDNLPPAIQFVADFLTGTLFPALHQVYDFISTYVEPVLAQLAQWLIANVPIAIQMTVDFVNTILIPAFQAIWAFIQTNVIPIFVEVANWLGTNVPAATSTTASFWTGTLLPALNSVWTFINTYVIPLFTALVNLHLAVLGLAVRALTAVWNTELLPALTSIWKYISTTLGPVIDWLTVTILKPLFQILNDIEITIFGTLNPMLTKLSGLVKDEVAHAFNSLSNYASAAEGALRSIGSAIQGVISFLNSLADKFNSIHPPSWLEGHSPPPMANWFTDIGMATRALNQQLPALQANLSAQIGPQGQSITNTASTRSFAYSPTIYTSGSTDMPMDLALANSLASV